jgi:hypothetical protein
MMLAGMLLVSLSLHVTTGGKATVARVYITDESGKAYVIPGAVTFSKGEELDSIVDRIAEVSLPPGKYKIRAEKGPEYGSAEKTVQLPASVNLEIPHFYNMNKHGWYSGDMHLHRSAAEMRSGVLAEDLNVAPVISRHVLLYNDKLTVSPSFPTKSLDVIDRTHVVSLQNQELERLGKGWGALIFFNVPLPIDSHVTDLYPLALQFARLAKAQGGFVDGEKPIWKTIPVNVAFGTLDSIGVVSNHFHPHDVLLDAEKYGSMERDKPAYQTIAGFAQWIMDLYYSFLNCGFRLPASAGSASGVMPSWPGYERVYVHLDGPFSYAAWFEGLKAGRSIATNGPLLQVFVNGKPPGAEFQWHSGMHLPVSIEVHSKERLDRVEIVYNGEVIRVLPANGRLTFKKTIDLPIERPGWLAVRCFDPVTSTLQYAHSSPFYFPENGKLPIKQSEPERWANYIHQLAASVGPASYQTRADYQQTQATLKDAENVYRRLMTEAPIASAGRGR